MSQKKGQFFIDKRGIHEAGGTLVRGIRYPDEKNRVVRLMFKISVDRKWLVLIRGETPWTAGFIRKDGWVNRLIDLNKVVPERHGGKFGYIFK
jgi:hypothetical protein